MKQPQFRITRDEKGGELFYALSCPAFLSPDKKKKRFLFKRRADAEKKRAELVALATHMARGASTAGCVSSQ